MAFQTVFKRYELKYMLTLEQKEKVLEAMKPYMSLDKYGRTTIRNIYFDTDNYRLIRRSIDKPTYKEKLRIRSYSRAKSDISSASHGLDVNDSVRIANADITIDAGKDGIHSENSDDASLGFVYISSGSITIEAEGDGVSAGAYIQIQGGTIELACGGGYKNDDDSTSMKGLKAVSGILISDGTITIDSADDSIHCDASITINGGTFDMASGDDGVHAEDTLTVTGCTMKVSHSYEGLEALKIYMQGGEIEITSSDDGINASGDTSVLDADVSPTITGGTFISTGSTTMMAQSFDSSSTQGVIACTTGTQSAGTTVTVKDSSGNTVVSYEAEYKYVLVIISSPDIVKGETYTLNAGSYSKSVKAS